jgi:hypothetical protein
MSVGALASPVIDSATVTSTSSIAVAYNGRRARLYVENTSDWYNVYLNWGAAAVVGQGRRVQCGGGSFEFEITRDGQLDWAKDALHAISDGDDVELTIEEVSR